MLLTELIKYDFGIFDQGYQCCACSLFSCFGWFVALLHPQFASLAWLASSDATAMCDVIRITHPHIASDAKNRFLLAMRKLLMIRKNSNHSAPERSCEILRCWPAMPKITCFWTSSDAKCLRFELSLRSGLRCDCVRCQIASDLCRTMRTTKGCIVLSSALLIVSACPEQAMT